MVRLPLLVSAFTVATLAAAPAAAAPITDPAAEPVEISFALPANNDLRAHLQTFNGEVELEIERRNHYVSYETQGEATEAGLKVRFGKLGLIDVAFTPTETRIEKPPKGCRGEPSVSSQGVFIGSIDFTGEREYVRIEATRVEGSLDVYRESEWTCKQQTQAVRGRGAPLPPAVARRRPGPKAGPAVLTAYGRRCGCLFVAYTTRKRHGGGRTFFAGAKFEHREGMEILRSIAARAGAAAFAFDFDAGAARVRPPSPFQGYGIFMRRPHARPLWRSTVQVPLLGIGLVPFGGPGFRAHLSRESPFS